MFFSESQPPGPREVARGCTHSSLQAAKQAFLLRDADDRAVPNSARQERRSQLQNLSRRRTLILAATVGVLAGLSAVLFRLAVEATETWRDQATHSLWEGHHGVGLAVMLLGGAALGALSSWITQRCCPEAAGSGIPHVKAVLVTGRHLRSWRLMATKVGAGLLSLGAGMSLGREGPTVHIGASAAEAFSGLTHLPGRVRRSLIAAGAGAGLAAAFNAPLAGFLFIMEELRRDLSRGTYGTALVASLASVSVTRLLLGYESIFTLPDPLPLRLTSLPALVAVGLLAAPVGLAFNTLLLRSTARPGNRLLRGAAAGALCGVLALLLPQATGGGNSLTGTLLEGNDAATLVWSHLLLLLIVKLLFTVLCYASGVPGGFFAPLLTMGAVLGALTSVALQTVMPTITPSPERLAVVGMAAVLTASVRAPLTGVVLIVEMTGQYHTLFSLLLASLVAYAACETARSEPIYEALLERDLKKGEKRDKLTTFEVTVESGSDYDGATVAKLGLPASSLLALVDRDGGGLVPRGSTRLLAGDVVTVVVGKECDDLAVSALLNKFRGA